MIPWSLALILAATRTLVLPFEGAGDPPETPAWTGSAFEEAISSHLLAAGRDVVEIPERNGLLDEMGFLPGEPLTRATSILLAKELGASRAVLGEYRDEEGSLEVTVRLIDIERGATLGVVEDFGAASELSELANQVAKNLFRIERDDAPPGFDACARRRGGLSAAALEASARARLCTDPAERRAFLERALSLAPSYLEARLMLGRLHLDSGSTRAAIDVLAEATGEDGIYRAAYFDLGVAYLEEGELASALQIFRALSHGSSSPEVLNNLGVALLGTGDAPAAIEAFARARELGSGQPTYAFNLGWSFWRAGKGAGALAPLREAVASDPIDAEARFLLAAAAAAQAEVAEAERLQARAILLSPPLARVEAATVTGWERIVHRRGAPVPVSALPVLDEGADPESWVDLFDARAFRARNRLDEAAQRLQRSLYRKPGATDIRRELAELHVERGEYERAVSELAVVLWADPSAEGHVALARVYLEMDEPLKAHEQVERALELDPDLDEARELQVQVGPNGERETLLR